MKNDKYGLFTSWLDECARQDCYPYMLERKGYGTGLFQIQKHHEYYDTSYHVWVDGEWIAASSNYMEAYNIYMMYTEPKFDIRDVLPFATR